MANAKQDNWKATENKVVLIQPIDMPLPAGLWEGGIRKNGRVALMDSTSSVKQHRRREGDDKQNENGGNCRNYSVGRPSM